MTVIPREQHSISRKDISENALKVYRLNKSGYEAYLVGGGVAICCSAKAERLRHHHQRHAGCASCSATALVGRRFRLAHVMFGPEIIEWPSAATTNRIRNPTKTRPSRRKRHAAARQHLRLDRVKIAQRRDFTINSLYYGVADFTLRVCRRRPERPETGRLPPDGDPETRYREDPVRMLRAVRFAAAGYAHQRKRPLEPIPRPASLLHEILPARLFEESLKLLQAGYASTYRKLCGIPAVPTAVPADRPQLHAEPRYADGAHSGAGAEEHRSPSAERHARQPAFLFAAMLWYHRWSMRRSWHRKAARLHDAFALAMNDVLDEQCRSLAIPKTHHHAGARYLAAAAAPVPPPWQTRAQAMEHPEIPRRL